MPTTYLDEEGNEVETLSPEEVKEMEEKTKELEERANKATELEEQLKAKEEALAKMSDKDYNFKRLREKSEQEVEEMKKKMSEKEKLLLTEVMDLTKEREEEKTRRFEETKDEVLSSLSAGDDEVRKLIEGAEKELAGEAKTPKELEDRYRKAYILAKGEAPMANPLFSGYSSSYREPDTKAKRFTDTDKGKESMKAWFGEDIANRVYKQ